MASASTGALSNVAGEAGERGVALGADGGDDRVDLGLEGREVGLGAGEEAAGAGSAESLREVVEVDLGHGSQIEARMPPSTGRQAPVI